MRPGDWERLTGMLAPRGPGAWLYRDAHYLAVDMDVDARAARRWVPSPLRLAEPARATIFTAWFPHTTFGSAYREAGLFLHVTHGRARAIFSPWMIVDDDVALITGRELLGYPKKLGEIAFDVDGDRVTSRATRRGAEIVRIDATLGARVAAPPPILGRPHRNVRSAMGLALPKVIAFHPREEPIEVRRADVAVTIGGSERDPISDLGFGAVRAAHLHRVNLGGRFPPVPRGIVSPAWYVGQWLLRAH